ncbi:hypothetical protein [Microbacterium sp. P01]|uniref:hypothetical protein n=1 Tax=unclassified Microbacterium TaxID=2609290 RepID=UPI003672FF1A
MRAYLERATRRMHPSNPGSAVPRQSVSRSAKALQPRAARTTFVPVRDLAAF